MKNKASELKKEAEVIRLSLEDAEKKLRLALEEAEAAKAAEATALDHIKVLSERTSAACSSTSESISKITISTEEFESLGCKVQESDKLADMKVAAAISQVEAVKASENEALKQLEATQKEIEDMKTTSQEALKRAEMAEAARRAVESELRRWHECKQKKAAEAASQYWLKCRCQQNHLRNITGFKNKIHLQLLLRCRSRIQKQNPPPITAEVQKLEKEKVSASKKVLLPNIGSMFHRKKHRLRADLHIIFTGRISYEVCHCLCSS